LVHGYFGGSAHWDEPLGYLSTQFDVVAVDLPGFGESAGLVPPLTIRGFAAAVLSLLDDLGLGGFCLLGHSMGGMIAQEIVHQAGSRVEKLVLYGTGPLGLLPNRFESIETSRQRLLAEGVASTAWRISATWFVKGADDPGHADCARIGAMASEAAGLAGLAAMEAWDGRALLGAIACPTQIVWGEHDRSYGFEEQTRLCHGIPDASLAVIPEGAHACHLEQPAIFRSVLEAFLPDRDAVLP
jgi:pimeloyl-ACP methyl ester carboxylesterase